MRIGVLGLQGGVQEHLEILRRYKEVNGFSVKRKEEIEKCDGMILPGGESTAMGKLLEDLDLKRLLIQKIQDGMPVWGTCAGLILLAKKIINEDKVHLGVMNIAVKRNSYGTQIDSFIVKEKLKGMDKEIPFVFIRAPQIEKVGKEVEVLSVVRGKIVAAKERNILVTSFHPELTKDSSVHDYFIEKIIKKIPSSK